MIIHAEDIIQPGKRRKQIQNTNPIKKKKTFHYIYTLDTLPSEVIETILKFLSYEDLANIVRLVSK